MPYVHTHTHTHTMAIGVFLAWGLAIGWLLFFLLVWWLATLPPVAVAASGRAPESVLGEMLWANVLLAQAFFSSLLSGARSLFNSIFLIAGVVIVLAVLALILPVWTHVDTQIAAEFDRGFAANIETVRDDFVNPIFNTVRLTYNSVVPAKNLVDIVIRSTIFELTRSTVKCLTFDPERIVNALVGVFRSIGVAFGDFFGSNIFDADNEFDFLSIALAFQELGASVLDPFSTCWCADLSFISDWLVGVFFHDTSLPRALHHWFNHGVERWRVAGKTLGLLVFQLAEQCPKEPTAELREQCQMAREPRFDALAFHYQEAGVHLTDWADNAVQRAWDIVVNRTALGPDDPRPPETARLVRGLFATWRMLRLFTKIVFNPVQLVTSLLDLVPRNIQFGNLASATWAAVRQTFVPTSVFALVPPVATIDPFPVDFMRDTAHLITHIDTIASSGIEWRLANLPLDFAHWYNTSRGFEVFFDAFRTQITDDLGCTTANLHNITVQPLDFTTRLMFTLPRADTDTVPFLADNGTVFAGDFGRDVEEFAACVKALADDLNEPVAKVLRDVVRFFRAELVLFIDLLAHVDDDFLAFLISQENIDNFNALFDAFDSLFVSLGNVLRQFSFSPGATCPLRDLVEDPSDDGISRDIDYFCMLGGFIDATGRIFSGLLRAGIVGALEIAHAIDISGNLTPSEVDEIFLNADAPLNLDRVVARFDDFTWVSQWFSVGPALTFVACPGKSGASVGSAYVGLMQAFINGTSFFGLGLALRGFDVIFKISGIALKDECSGGLVDECVCPFFLLLYDTFIAAPLLFVQRFGEMLGCLLGELGGFIGFLVDAINELWEYGGWDTTDSVRNLVCPFLDILFEVFTMLVALFTGDFETFFEQFILIVEQFLEPYLENFLLFVSEVFDSVVCAIEVTEDGISGILSFLDHFIDDLFDDLVNCVEDFPVCPFQIPPCCGGFDYSQCGLNFDVQLGACCFSENCSNCGDFFTNSSCETYFLGTWLGAETSCALNASDADEPMIMADDVVVPSSSTADQYPVTVLGFLQYFVNTTFDPARWARMDYANPTSPCHAYWYDYRVLGHNTTIHREALTKCTRSVLRARRWGIALFRNLEPEHYVVPPLMFADFDKFQVGVGVLSRDLHFALDVELTARAGVFAGRNITSTREFTVHLEATYGVTRAANFSKWTLARWAHAVGTLLSVRNVPWQKVASAARAIFGFLGHVVEPAIISADEPSIATDSLPPSPSLPPLNKIDARAAFEEAWRLWLQRLNVTFASAWRSVAAWGDRTGLTRGLSVHANRFAGLYHVGTRRFAEVRGVVAARHRNSTAEAIRNCQGAHTDFTQFPAFNMCVSPNERDFDFGLTDGCFNCSALQNIVDVWAVNTEATVNDYECPLRFETDLDTFCDVYVPSGTDGRILTGDGDGDGEDAPPLPMLSEFEAVLDLLSDALQELFGGARIDFPQELGRIVGDADEAASGTVDFIERLFTCDYVNDVRCESGDRGVGFYFGLAYVLAGFLALYLISQAVQIPFMQLPIITLLLGYLFLAAWFFVGFNMSPSCVVPNAIGATVLSAFGAPTWLAALFTFPLLPQCAADDAVCPVVQAVNVSCYSWPGVSALLSQQECPTAAQNFQRDIQQCSATPFKMQGIRVTFFWLERLLPGVATFLRMSTSPIALSLRLILPAADADLSFPPGVIDDSVWQACSVFRILHLIWGLLLGLAVTSIGLVVFNMIYILGLLYAITLLALLWVLAWLLMPVRRRRRQQETTSHRHIF